MNKIMIAFSATLAIMSFGCKKKGGDSSGAAMAKISELKDKMCACKDADCAKKVSDEMTTWSQEQAKNQKEPVKMSDADQKKAAEVSTAMGECMQKAMTPAAGSAEPAAAGSAEAAASGMPECDEYSKLADKYLACESVPKENRDNLKKGLDDMRKMWASGLPDDMKKTTAENCKGLTADMKKNAAAMNCAL